MNNHFDDIMELHQSLGLNCRIINKSITKCKMLIEKHDFDALTKYKIKRLCADFVSLRNELDNHYCEFDILETENSPYYGGVTE